MSMIWVGGLNHNVMEETHIKNQQNYLLILILAAYHLIWFRPGYIYLSEWTVFSFNYCCSANHLT